MKLIKLDSISKTGAPLYEMQKIFSSPIAAGDFSFSIITIPAGSRVPASGTGFHDMDEYSFFLEGEVYTESGGDSETVGAGMATLIPKGEAHWCENRTDKDCKLVCIMAPVNADA